MKIKVILLNSYQTLFCLIIILFVSISACWADYCQGWSEIAIKLLPDNSFAYIEIQPSEIQPNGVTAKKVIRHCPYRDKKGKIDYEQLIYELGTFSKEIWLNQKNRDIALKQLKLHYDSFIQESMNNNPLKEVININSAPLTKLVLLPRIGPVLAVKIVCYRKTHTSFKSIEEIKQIEGIGQGTFNAVRFYISVQ